MVELVFNNEIAAATQALRHRQVGHIAGGKQQCPRIAGEFSQCQFQLVVDFAVPIHQVRRAAAHAIALRGINKGLFNRRVVAQAQVVVAGEVEQRLPIELDLPPLRAL